MLKFPPRAANTSPRGRAKGLEDQMELGASLIHEPASTGVDDREKQLTVCQWRQRRRQPKKAKFLGPVAEADLIPGQQHQPFFSPARSNVVVLHHVGGTAKVEKMRWRHHLVKVRWPHARIEPQRHGSKSLQVPEKARRCWGTRRATEPGPGSAWWLESVSMQCRQWHMSACELTDTELHHDDFSRAQVWSQVTAFDILGQIAKPRPVLHRYDSSHWKKNIKLNRQTVIGKKIKQQSVAKNIKQHTLTSGKCQIGSMTARTNSKHRSSTHLIPPFYRRLQE